MKLAVKLSIWITGVNDQSRHFCTIIQLIAATPLITVEALHYYYGHCLEPVTLPLTIL